MPPLMCHCWENLQFKDYQDKAPSTYFSRPNNALVLVITLNISFFGLPSLLTFCDKNPFSTLLERKSYWTEEGFEREKERLRCCLLDLSVLSQAFQSVVLELWQKGKKILANRSQPSAKWQSTKPINSQSSLFSLFSRVLRISFQPFILRSITRCIPTLDTNNNFLT